LYLHKLQFADICIVQRQVTLLWDIAAYYFWYQKTIVNGVRFEY